MVSLPLPAAQLAAYGQAPYSGYLVSAEQNEPIRLRGVISPASLQQLEQLQPPQQLLSFQLQLKPLTGITSQEVWECLRLRNLRQDVMFTAAILRAFRQGVLPKALSSESCLQYQQGQGYYVPGTLARELVQLD